MKLTQAERTSLINILFEEALANVKRAGCTCTPSWRLSEECYGPHGLPAWISDHFDDCAMAALLARRESAPKHVDNGSLSAGSPMYYYCKNCGHLTAELPEDWYQELPPTFCDWCQEHGYAG